MKVSGLATRIGAARVVQFVRSVEVCSVRVRPGVLVMTRVTEPSAARWIEPKLGAVGSAVGTVTLLASRVTAPVWANSRPSTAAPVARELEAEARMFPLNTEAVPRVAELPTCQTTLAAWAPPLRITCRPDVVVSVEAIWKMNTAFAPPGAWRGGPRKKFPGEKGF